MYYKYTLFGNVCWIIFGATALVSALVIALVKKFPSSERWINWILAILLLVSSKLTGLYFSWSHGDLTLQNALPMQPCDLATFTTLIVLLRRNQLLFEVSYYWGLVGTTQAILTPDLIVNLADPRFYAFFISHGGVLIAILYLTLGLCMRPSKFSVWKVFGITQLYIVVTLLLDRLIDANYGYLCAKPQNPSLFDYLGPWPWYILSIEILVLVFFFLCYTPFYFLSSGERLLCRKE